MEEVDMIMISSTYPQQMSMRLPEAPRFVGLGTCFNIVVLITDAIIALKKKSVIECYRGYQARRERWIEGIAGRTYIIPRLKRQMSESFIRVWRFKFQNTHAEKTARNKSAAELKARAKLA